MGDSAKGPGAGYIYQFELALVELAKMSKTNVLSIEKMDDLAIQNQKGHYMMTIQAKHSISMSGTNFGNTSVDLWKTIVNWIAKLKSGEVISGNHFKAITNVSIPSNSIIRKFGIEESHEIVDQIRKIKNKLEVKIAEIEAEGKKAPSRKETVNRLNIVLNDLPHFETILSSFSFIENYEHKEDFFDNIQIGSISDNKYKDELYENFLGWVVKRSIENWNNGKESEFTKKDFEEKYHHLRRIHPLKNALFRNKKDIPEISKIDLTATRDDTYILQIEDIDRDSDDKDEIIKDAILDFILSDIEISLLITSSNTITKPDYEDFKETCLEAWKKVKRKHAPYDPSKYTEDEKNDIAIKVFDEIMAEIQIDFMKDFNFDNTNRYIQNGTFLRLSDEPKIGWNPSWKERYKK